MLFSPVQKLIRALFIGSKLKRVLLMVQQLIHALVIETLIRAQGFKTDPCSCDRFKTDPCSCDRFKTDPCALVIGSKADPCALVVG